MDLKKRSKKIDHIHPSPIRKVVAKTEAARKQGIKVTDFSVGRPDFDTPAHIKNAAVKALDAGLVHYTDSSGILALRKAVCDRVESENGVAVSPDQVLITAGATEAIYIALQAILTPGDEILAPEPMFVYYRGGAILADAECTGIPLCPEENFKLTADKLSQYISPRTKVLILTSPHNPTGQVYDREELVKIAALSMKHDFYIISDDIYNRLVYDDASCFNIMQVSGMENRTIIVQSFSKMYAMDGWRAGYLVAPLPVVTGALKIHQHIMSCPNTFVQWGAYAALTGDQSCVEVMRQEFDRRRKLMMKFLDEFGFSYVQPRGAFYIFPSIAKWGMTSEAFCDFIFDGARVAIVPGNAFGDAGEGFVRLSYATSYEDIEKGMIRVGEALKKLRGC